MLLVYEYACGSADRFLLNEQFLMLCCFQMLWKLLAFGMLFIPWKGFEATEEEEKDRAVSPGG
jgi:hypothetical protein